MGKKSPSAPPPPDPYVTAQAQTDMNKQTAIEQARLNRINEVTPFGSVTYKNRHDAEVPFERVVSLSPQQQRLLNSQSESEIKLADLGGQVLDRVSPQLAAPFDISDLGSAPVADAEYRRRMEDALMERMQPRLQQDRERLETQLSNQGFSRGTEGFGRALDSQNRAVNDARLAVIGAAGDETARALGMENASRQQAIQERATARSQPLNEIAAILGTGQVTAPQFSATPQVGVGGVDLAGLVNNNYATQVNQANAKANAHNRGLGSIMSLAGAAFGAF